MTEDQFYEARGRLAGRLMTRAGLNIEAHEWHVILDFLASDENALADFRASLDHVTRGPQYLPGVFTPQGQVQCAKCLGQKDVQSTTVLSGYGVTPCMKCHMDVSCREDVADLNNLRLALPRGWYPRLEQTGGMTCNLYMDVAGHEYMVSSNDDPEPKFVVCWFPDSERDADSHHIGYFNTVDEIVMAVTKYRFRFGVRV